MEIGEELIDLKEIYPLFNYLLRHYFFYRYITSDHERYNQNESNLKNVLDL